MPTFGGQGTSLITVDNPDIYAIGVSQSPGQLAPAFNVQIFPDRATPAASWFSYAPPVLSVTIGGESYTCLPEQDSVEIAPDETGVAITVQYYPQAVVRLQNMGLIKNLVFLSCPDYEFALLESEYDTEHYEVLHKSCDVYTSDGWTVQEIIAKIAEKAGISINTMFPTFHVPNPTVILQRGQEFLPFLMALLPGDFDYIWTLIGDIITISLVQPPPAAASISFISGMYKMSRTARGVPRYDFVEVRGGEYKWGDHRVSLGGSVGLGARTTYPDGKLITENLPVQSRTTSEGTEKTTVSRTYLTGPDGVEFFALQERTTTITLAGTEISQMVESFTYENDAPNIYRQPRQTQMTTVRAVPYCTVSVGKGAGGDGVAYLTNDSRVLTSDEYDAIDPGSQPTVLCTATQSYGTNVETITETFEWITTDDADRNWSEGTQKAHDKSIEKRYAVIDGLYYPAMLAPRALLQAALSDMGTKSVSMSQPTVSSATKTAELSKETLALVSQGAFQQLISTSVFDPKQDTMNASSRVQTINGRPSGNPSVYRTEPMVATLAGQGMGSGGGFKTGTGTCIPYFAQIMTNNPDDFTRWTGLLWDLKSRSQRSVSAVSFSRLLPMGFTIGGVTFSSFQATQNEDGAQSVVMGGI